MARTFGADLVQRIAEGSLIEATSEYLYQTRSEVSQAIEELIDVGARIRPLYADGKQIGWVRGVHLMERKALRRWIYEPIEFADHLLRLGTTLTPEQIEALSMVELRSISRLIREMTESDLRLFPFIAPFVTTSVSEQLWYSKGAEGEVFRERNITLPDGKVMRIIAAPDQARLWAALCNYRIQAKARVEASTNAVMLMRAWVGKAVDPLAHDLKTMARSLQTDSIEPWKDLVRARPESRFNDGWAHSDDDSLEGMRRELDGWRNNDKHEQAVSEWVSAAQAEAEKRLREMESRIAAHQLRQAESLDRETDEVLTEAQVRERQLAWQKAQAVPEQIVPENQSSLESRLAKYR